MNRKYFYQLQSLTWHWMVLSVLYALCESRFPSSVNAFRPESWFRPGRRPDISTVACICVTRSFRSRRDAVSAIVYAVQINITLASLQLSQCIISAPNRNTNALLQLPSTQFVAQIYHTFPFTTCFGLMGPSSGTLRFYNPLFLFLPLSPNWPVFTHWGCVVCMFPLCPFCCKMLKYEITKIVDVKTRVKIKIYKMLNY
jgi:hypothetical protein